MVKKFLWILVLSTKLHGMEKEPEYYFDRMPRELRMMLKPYLLSGDSKFIEGWDLAHHLIFYKTNNLNLLKFLLSMVNPQKPATRIAFGNALINGHAHYVDAFIKAGMDVNQASYDKRTLLHSAAQLGNAKIIQLLIENGACVNCVDDEGDTPLMIATLFNRVEAVKQLLAAGADANARRICRNCKYSQNEYPPSWNGPRSFVCHNHQSGTARSLANERGYHEIANLFDV